MVAKNVVYENQYRIITNGEDDTQWLIELKEPELGQAKKRQKSKFSSINLEIAEHIYAYLNSFHVPTIFIKKKNENSYIAKKINRIPIKTVVFNTAVDHLVKDFGAEDGASLDSPVLEFYKTTGKNKDIMVNEYHAMAFTIATADEFRMMGRMATKINAILKSFFSRRGMTLVSFVCEFGLENGHLTLMSEIDMNACRFIDPNAKKEKDVFDSKNGNPEKAYQELKSRILS